MNWIDRHSRVDEDVTVGSFRINPLLFANDLVLLASSQQGLHHALNRFSAVCDQAGMKISTKNTEVLCLSANPRQCTLDVSRNILQQVAKFKYFGLVLRSDGRLNEKIGTRIGKANAVLYELYRSVITKRELSNNAKLSGFKSFFVPIGTYAHEPWVMTESIPSQEQATEMGFLWRVNGVTLCDKARSYEICKSRKC